MNITVNLSSEELSYGALQAAASRRQLVRIPESLNECGLKTYIKVKWRLQTAFTVDETVVDGLGACPGWFPCG